MLNSITNNQELVTIILTTLNSERYVYFSLKSCLEQTYKNIEILVVDGGSTDKTLDIVREFSDERIRIINQEGNTGKLPGAINLGLEQSKGQYITWTQDDCRYEPEAINMMLTFLLNHPGIGLVYADYWDIDEQELSIKYNSVRSPEDILNDDVIRVCFLFRREVYDTIGPQEPKYHPVHEVPWRIKVAKKYNIQPFHVPLLRYIVRDDSLTGRYGIKPLWKQLADILLAEGIYDQKHYRQRLSEVDMDLAFDAFIQRGDYATFWRQLISAITQDAKWLIDRGVWKFMFMSITPYRETFRKQIKREPDQENITREIRVED